MRFPKALTVFLLFCAGPVRALSIDGDPQLHAAVGQPLSVSVPISLAGDEVSRLYYRLTPGAGLAEAEEHAAASVHASYDPSKLAIILSTAARVTVPAIRLHLEIGAGDVVVGRELTVLFDLPDLNTSAPLDGSKAVAKPANDAHADLTAEAPPVPEGARGISIGREQSQGAAASYGDSAARGATALPAAPAAPQTVIAPRPHYFSSYLVRRGDTLTSIGEHLARAGAGNAEAVMLAVFEANVDAFPAGDPQHPLVGKRLEIPDAASIASEPRYRINEFKDYLRKPLGEWQVPVTLLPRPAAAPAEATAAVDLPAFWSRHLHLLVGLAVVALLLLAMQRLFRRGNHARAVAARRAAMAASGGAPVVQPNMLLPDGYKAAREPHLSLIAAPQPDVEQAEITRLRGLVEQQPTRADLRLRLAQRLYEARRSSGFAETALPLQRVLSPDAWEKVRQMGHELLPLDYRFQPQHALTPAADLRALAEPRAPARETPPPKPPAAAAIDFDFHGEMARVDKARRDVFGDSGGGSQAA